MGLWNAYKNALKDSLDPEKQKKNMDKGQWYCRTKDIVHVSVYNNESDFQKEANRALLYNWTIQDTAVQGRKFSVGKALAGSVVSFGLGAIAGLSSTKGKITVTYMRVDC